MIEDGRFVVELSQHLFFKKKGKKKGRGSSNKKQETLDTLKSWNRYPRKRRRKWTKNKRANIFVLR
jgi:hypothetical protein